MDGWPKYWDHSIGSFEMGAPALKTSKKTIPIEALYGTHSWKVQWDGLTDPTYPTEEEYSGYIAIAEAPAAVQVDDAINEVEAISVSGSFRMWCQTATFTGLTLIDPNYNAWGLTGVTWPTLSKEELGKLPMEVLEEVEGHEIRVLDVTDDEGHPFVEFALHSGYGRHGCLSFFMGKRDTEGEVPGNATDLTEDEEKRLNWNVGVEELEERNAGEDEDEEDETSSEEEEAQESEASAGEDGAAGSKKRKAADGDAVGSSKRKK